MVYIENIKNFDKVMVGKKFDIIFSNPPYNKNLDLKILEKLFHIAKNIVFVHPAGYLVDKKFVTNLYNRIRNTNYLETVNLFWGNKLFNIDLFVPMCISFWNTTKTSPNCIFNNEKIEVHPNDISFLSKEIFEMIERIKKLNNNKTLYTERVKKDYSNLTNYSVKFAAIRGHIDDAINGWCKDFFTMIALGNENIVDKSFKYPEKVNHSCFLLWSFESENERKNFVKYCKTKFARIALATRKNSGHLDSTEIANIPWLDFTQEWNDAKLCKEFGISEELWNYIDKFIPDYYNDYESGFEK